MTVSVFVILRQKHLFVCKITGKKDGSRSKTGEQALESIPAGEGTCVSPCLTNPISTKPDISLDFSKLERTVEPMDPSLPRQTGDAPQP